MGLSFRKSVQILPGVKLNLSKSGVSVSTGIKGLHASINTKGQVRGTASLTGTGLRYSKSVNLKKVIAEASEKAGKSSDAKKTSKANSAKTQAAKTGSSASKKSSKAELAASGSSAAELAAAQTAKEAKAKKGELSKEIMSLYAVSDLKIDWNAINGSTKNPGYENWDYLKARAEKVLAGDIDTYLEIISDVNPFNELIELGSQFECGTDNPMKMHIEFRVCAADVLGDLKDDKDLLEDYIAGTAIKAARDIFALLPLWQVELTAVDYLEGDIASAAESSPALAKNIENKTYLFVKFTRDSFENLKFEKLDASDTVRKLGGIMAC